MTPYLQTTAHDRSILEHYFMHAGEGEDHRPWKGGSENWLSLDNMVIARFIEAGLLVSEVNNGVRRIVANREALSTYFNALDCVPLPVRVWKIPEFQA